MSGYGVSAGASTFSDCPSFCTGDSDFDSNGGEFASNASAISSVFGTSKARAYYNGSETYLPELKAFSSSTGGQGGSASAFGVQGYTYEGTESETITIEFVLDANVLDSGSFGSESTSASLGVLGASGPLSSSPEYFSDFGTWYFENLNDQLGNGSVAINTPNGSDSGSVSFIVEPGDIFFVGASIRASSRTGTADAFNTFTSSFINLTDGSRSDVGSRLFVANPVSVSVPEPSSLAFLSAIICGFTARRRRSDRR